MRRVASVLWVSLWIPILGWASQPSLPPNALPVPLVRQAHDYSCGAAALAAVLQYWQVFDDGEAALYRLIKTTRKDGTHPQGIAHGARTYGLETRIEQRQTLTDLRAGLARGETIILDIQAWPDQEEESGEPDWENLWDDGHYVVLIALDDRYAYVMDPSTTASYGFIPLAELERRWHDYEDRNGKIERHHQLAIYMNGRKSLPSFPAPLQRVE